MIRFRFGHQDLLSLRFAVSATFEVVCAVGLLREAEPDPFVRPWQHDARERLRGVDYPILDALVNPAGYTPDFFSPPPTSWTPSLEADLREIARTSPAQIDRELSWRFGRSIPAAVKPLIEAPVDGVELLCEEIRAFWAAALEPDWARILQIAKADILYRSRRLVESGAAAVFDDLHSDLHWTDEELRWDRPHDQVIELRGRGLMLVPVVLKWPGLSGLLNEEWQHPAIIYPPRGVAALYAQDRAASGASLSDLIGRRRALILSALDEPRTTSHLSVVTGWSLGSVSGHLSVLRHNGLVSRQRDGRYVIYRRTELGDGLVSD